LAESTQGSPQLLHKSSRRKTINTTYERAYQIGETGISCPKPVMFDQRSTPDRMAGQPPEEIDVF